MGAGGCESASGPFGEATGGTTGVFAGLAAGAGLALGAAFAAGAGTGIGLALAAFLLAGGDGLAPVSLGLNVSSGASR